MTKKIHARIVQMDGIEAFASYLSPSARKGKAIIGLNVEAMLSNVCLGHIKPEEVPYLVAESIMHEVIHVLEDWAKVEFNEDRVEALIMEYREKAKVMRKNEKSKKKSIRKKSKGKG